jgi:hypothetical protein
MVDNKSLKVSLARAANPALTQANLYVANLPKHYTKTELEQMFLPYGQLLDTKVMLGVPQSNFILRYLPLHVTFLPNFLHPNPYLQTQEQE